MGGGRNGRMVSLIVVGGDEEWLVWISARRSGDARNVFARDMWRLPWCEGSQIVEMRGDVCLVEGGGHMERQRMESLVRETVTTNQDFVSVSRAGTSEGSATSGRHLGITVEERLDQPSWIESTCFFVLPFALGNEISMFFHAWQIVKAWRVRNVGRRRGS